MQKQSKIVLISGPTASGKSGFAVKLAKKINGEIINADSMQVYKQLKILTARPSKIEQKNIRHHLYGTISIKNKFSTGQWNKLAIKNIKEILKKNKIPILVGGTGLYFNTLINGIVKIPNIPINLRNKIRLMQKKKGQKKFYQNLLKIDPKVKNKFNPNDLQRSARAFEVKLHTKISLYDWIGKTKSKFQDSDFLKIYIDCEREKLIKNIVIRTSKMIKNGAINEVINFNKFKLKRDLSANKIIGISELTKYLNDEIKLDETKQLISIRTRQYAKRQATWARSKMISWNKIAPDEISSFVKKINKSSLKLDQLI